MTSPCEDATPKRSTLDKALCLFSEVRPGEGACVVLMLANIFVLLLAYYIIKTVREPLILTTGGAELKSYASAAMAAVLVFFVPAYGWLASRATRVRLIVTTILFFFACLQLFYLGGRLQIPNLGFFFYVWVGIFNMAAIAQFWAYANDIYTKQAGDRLFPVIAIGATGGSWAGSKTAEYLFKGGVSPYDMMQIAAVLLIVHLMLYVVVNRGTCASSHQARATTETLERGGGFGLVLGSPYIKLIAVMMVLLNMVNSTGEYILGSSVVQAANAQLALDPNFNKNAFIGAFYGNFNAWVSAVSLLLQAFVASRLVKHLGLRGVLLALPLVAFGGYSLIAAGVGFAVLRWIKTAENSTDYSIMNTAKHLLWLPTSRAEKYKAKQAVDTFFVRIGDVASAGLVFAGTAWLQLQVRGFAWLSVTLVIAWFVVSLLILRQHQRLLDDSGDATTSS